MTDRYLVLWQRVSEHAQALSVAAVALGAAYLAGWLPMPLSVRVWHDSAVVTYVWAAVFMASGLAILVAAWPPERWFAGWRRLRIERGGQLLQSGATLYFASGAFTMGLRGALGGIAFGAWGLACIVRAVRLRRWLAQIVKVAENGGG
jgi:hypothetical protein